jgi:hypothetical protein
VHSDLPDWAVHLTGLVSIALGLAMRAAVAEVCCRAAGGTALPGALLPPANADPRSHGPGWALGGGRSRAGAAGRSGPPARCYRALGTTGALLPPARVTELHADMARAPSEPTTPLKGAGPRNTSRPSLWHRRAFQG